MPKIAAALIAMAIVIALVLVARSETGADKPGRMADAISKELARAPKGSLRPEAVLAIAPRAASSAPRAASFQISLSAKEYYESRDFASLYERLAKGNRTPEENWVLGKILEYCAMVADEVPRGMSAPSKDVVNARRARFTAALSPSDPDRDKRLAAFDIATRNRCDGLPRLQSTRAEIDDLYRLGAAAGDQKARVALVIDDLRAQLREQAGKNGTPSFAKLGDDQMAAVRQALASNDPTTAMAATDIMLFTFANVSLRDQDGKTVDFLALRNAATLVACDSGYPCGPDTSEIAQGCAYMGRCDADNLRDFLLYYRSSPYDSQVLARYESALRSAALTGDTSFLVFYPALHPAVAAFQ